MSDTPSNLTGVLDEIENSVAEDETNVGAIISPFQGRSYGAIITFLGVLASIPFIGGIPGMSIILGAFLIIISLQHLITGGGALWLPERIKNIEVEGEKVNRAIEKAKPWTQWIDGFLGKRLTFLSSGTLADYLIPMCIIGLSLMFFPLALVPAGILLPAFGVVAFGLAIIGRDGLLAIAGYLFSAVAFYAALFLI